MLCFDCKKYSYCQINLKYDSAIVVIVLQYKNKRHSEFNKRKNMGKLRHPSSKSNRIKSIIFTIYYENNKNNEKKMLLNFVLFI